MSAEQMKASDGKLIVPNLTLTTSKVQGTATDVEFGQLKERFSVMSVIGVQFAIIGTPLAIGSYL